MQYVPYVGDSKRAMDEYTSEIFMGGKSTIVMHNTCEDSLLAAPIILDLVLLAELSTRIQLKAEDEVRIAILIKQKVIPIFEKSQYIDHLFELSSCRGNSTLSTLWPPSLAI